MIRLKSQCLLIASCFALIACVAGCATMGKSAPSLVPTRHTLDVGPYRIATNEPLAENSETVSSLVELERQVDQALHLPAGGTPEPIEVYVLDDKATFHHFLKFYYPELPPRRAFFFAQGSRRVVYAYRGERLDVDLRHEAAHALMHGAVANVPLWLDEGLAEYFECPDLPTGLNRENLVRLAGDEHDGWTPGLARLESLTEVRQMSPRDYREAWGWVHWLLHHSTETRIALLGYLSDLAVDPAATPLSQRLDSLGPGRANSLLLDHLRGLRQNEPVTKPAPIKARAQGADSVITLARDLPPADTRDKSIVGRLVDVVRLPFRRAVQPRRAD